MPPSISSPWAYGVNSDRAVKCLTRDRAEPSAFHGLLAEHWKYIRTTAPIKSTFATVRHRTTKTKDCLSRLVSWSMIHQMMLSAKKKWRKRGRKNRLSGIIQGIEVCNRITHESKAAFSCRHHLRIMIPVNSRSAVISYSDGSIG